jgi:predicted nucleic acid-binding Zn finger protein
LKEKQKTKRIVDDIIDLIISVSSKSLISKAEAAVNSLKYVLISEDPTLFVFLGEHGDYLIVDGIYCTCEAFQNNMLKGTPYCYHIIGSWIAMSKGKYHDLSKDLSLVDVNNIINEILEYGFSSTIRRILFKNRNS